MYVTVRDMISGGGGILPRKFFWSVTWPKKKIAWTLGKVLRPSPMQDPEKCKNLWRCQRVAADTVTTLLPTAAYSHSENSASPHALDNCPYPPTATASIDIQWRTSAQGPPELEASNVFSPSQIVSEFGPGSSLSLLLGSYHSTNIFKTKFPKCIFSCIFNAK